MLCVFIKNSHVANIAVFENKDEALASRIADEQSFDSYVWFANAEQAPNKYDAYDGKTFSAPSPEWLLENGIIDSLPAVNNPDTLIDHEDPEASSSGN